MKNSAIKNIQYILICLLIGVTLLIVIFLVKNTDWEEIILDNEEQIDDLDYLDDPWFDDFWYVDDSFIGRLKSNAETSPDDF